MLIIVSGTALACRMGEVSSKHLLKGWVYWVSATFLIEHTECQMGHSKIQSSSSPSQSKSLPWLHTVPTMGSKLLSGHTDPFRSFPLTLPLRGPGVLMG